MTKFKMFADFDREEQFLNDMAKKGFRLVNCSSPMYKFKLFSVCSVFFNPVIARRS